MINYKGLFLERMFAELSDEERDNNYKVICSHEQFASEEDEMQWFKEQYCHYYGFPTSNILNYKEKLFNLFDALVGIQLTEEEALDLKALCQEEENNLTQQEDYKINQHYYSRVNLFTTVNYSYNNFKLNIGTYTAKNIDKYIKHDELKNNSADLNLIFKIIPIELKRFFNSIINRTQHKELSIERRQIIEGKFDILNQSILSETSEIILRFNKYIIRDDANYERERKSTILKAEIKTFEEAKLIKNIVNNKIDITSTEIRTTSGDIKIGSDLQTIITKKELYNILIRKCYNSIEVDRNSDLSEAINLFDDNKEAYLFRAIAKVFLEYGLLSYRNNQEIIISEKHPNRNKLNIKMNGKTSLIIYDIATILVGSLPKLRHETPDPNEKMTIDDNDTKIKKGYTRTRLNTCLIPIRFKK